MRILINALSSRGGGLTYLANVLKFAPPEWRIFLLSHPSFDLTGLPSNVKQVEGHLQLDNPFLRAAWEYTHLGSLAHALKAEILFCPGGLLPPAYRLPASVKTAVTFQNMLPFDDMQRQRYKGYRRLRDWLLERGLSSAMQRADLVIFISQFARNAIESRLGSLRGTCVTIPHGIAPGFFPSATPLSLPAYMPREPYFLYVSYIDYYKSQIEVVRAFAQVRECAGMNAPLVLAGAENPVYGRELRQVIAQLGLEDAVHIIGNMPHADMPALYQHAEINLFASCTENCPNILLEMMASGRPGLVSNRGPMPEFGGDKVTYFNPDNVDQLAEQWMELLAEPQMAQQLAAQAREHISGKTWDNTAQAVWKAMKELV